MPWPTVYINLKQYHLPSLMIVLYVYRYDGRGALADLWIHEPPPGGFDQRTILTEEELKVEQLCDEERYRSLYNNDVEESMYHEEEIKRLHQALDSESSYNQVGYNYNEDENNEKASGEDSQSPKQSEGSQEEDQAFVPPPELEIPEGMILPETQKLSAIITKTALFISQHGSQLEILIKTKQANNPQFAFLSIDEPLHQYYKFLLDAIKNGKYNPEKQPEKEETESEEESDQDDESYLHPSLAPSFTKIEAAPSIPSIQYKPSADCAYSMLVNKITGKPPPSKVPQVLDPTMQPMPSTGYYHPMPLQSYPPYPTPMQYSHGPVIYGPNGQMQSPSQLVSMPTMSNDTTMTQTISPKETPSPLVPYGIPTQKPLSRPSFIVPPADVQIIIDKMASYVAKNGRDFETIVKNKGDPRFNFLELSHQYHGYYAHKLTIYEGAINPKVLTEEKLLQKQEPQEEKQKKLEELQKKQQRMEEVQKRVKMIQAKKKNGNDTKTKQSTGSAKQITTVSFSIKKPKDGESTVIEKRNALPLEESDEEMDDDKKDANSKPGSPQNSISDANSSIPVIEDKDPPKSDKKPKSDDKELVDLTDDILEDCQKEIRHKQAQEDRLKDKLMAVARDKILSKERQLQLERKKKAAIFLSHIQAPISKTGSTTITVNQNSRKDDSDEVHSVPSPLLAEENKDRSSQDTKTCGNSLMDRLKSADLSGKRSRQRSRSRSGSRTDRHKLHKKHKKKKSSHRSSYDSSSSSRSHRSKKNKKSSLHRSRSRSPSHRHRHNPRRRGSNTSYSDSSSP
ncbi:splicing factor, suppressor of white-apricot homolog isoform X1 [Formica exsecta]|uniref:splicing factor, suppressor of white-apricot homolog isoform X1 n=1 Tax=Formica exsecta TaxID=72781 RepID=UPI001142470B|nr:splicing factor, suppressor of white-apricot homolog isoform X1 [Formica exsecta]